MVIVVRLAVVARCRRRRRLALPVDSSRSARHTGFEAILIRSTDEKGPLQLLRIP